MRRIPTNTLTLLALLSVAFPAGPANAAEGPTRWEWDGVARVVAVGDVHGSADNLSQRARPLLLLSYAATDAWPLAWPLPLAWPFSAFPLAFPLALLLGISPLGSETSPDEKPNWSYETTTTHRGGRERKKRKKEKTEET